MTDRKFQSSCTVRGSINHDEYFRVSHIVRPGETLSSYGHESRVGGKGANQAVAIALAGGKTKFYGTIGKDGMWIRERMMDFGIDVGGIIVGEELTGRAIIQVDEEGENSIILYPGANFSDLHEQSFARRGNGWFPDCTHLLLQNEIPLRATYYALQSAHARGATVIMNPSPLPSPQEIREFPWYKVDWLVVNEAEAAGLYHALTARAPSQSSSPPAAKGSPPPKVSSPSPSSSSTGTGTSTSLSTRELIFSLSSIPSLRHTNIICTLGADGVFAFVPSLHRAVHEGDPLSFMHLPAAKLAGSVRDTTGAGDCFAGYFVSGLMEFANGSAGGEIREMDLVRILKMAVHAAGMCCERRGTIDSYPSRTEVEERMSASI